MADEKKTEAPLMGEVAASGAELDLSGYINEIGKPEDELLASLGGDLVHYERLLRDDQVQSTFQQRRRAVTSAEWDVTPASEAPLDVQAADFIREQLQAIRYDRLSDKMLYGVFYGYAVAECLWKIDGSRVVFDQVKVRKAKRFFFSRDGKLRLRKASSVGGMLMPDRKFWTFNVGADNDNDPYGRGLGFWLYWPVFLKRNGAQFWALALEKFGGPTVLGKYPAGTAPAEIRKLLAAASAVTTDAAVVVPTGTELSIMESMKGSGGDFDKFVSYWDGAIAKVVLSQTMTTDNGSSQSQANVHMDVRQDVVKGDADLLDESFTNGPIRWLTEWNFPGAGIPRVSRLIDEDEDLKAASDRDKTLHEIGWDLTEERVRDTYGDGYERKRTVAPTDPNGVPADDPLATEFAEGPRDDVDDLVDQLEEKITLDPMIDEIRKLAADSVDLADFSGRLLERYPQFQLGDFGNILAEALVVGDLGGRAEMIDG